MTNYYLFLLIASAVVSVVVGVKMLLYYRLLSIFYPLALIYMMLFNGGVIIFTFWGENYHEIVFIEDVINRLYLGQSLINGIILILFIINHMLIRWVCNNNVCPRQYPGGNNVITKALSTFFLLITIAYFYTNKQSFLQLFEVISSGDYFTYYQFRVDRIFEVRNVLINRLYIINNSIIIPVLGLYYLDRYLSLKSDLHWCVIFYCLWIVVNFISLQKAPHFIMLISTIVVYVYNKEWSRGFRYLKFSTVMIAISGVFIFSVVLFRIFGFIGGVGSDILGRVFLTPPFTSYAHLEVFPDYHDFVYYGGSRFFNYVFGMNRAPTFSTNYDSISVITGYLHQGAAFNMNSSILGEGWANFGYWGIIQQVLVVYGSLSLWDVILKTQSGYYRIIPLIAFFVGKLFNTLDNGMFGMLFNAGVFLGPLFFIIATRCRSHQRK